MNSRNSWARGKPAMKPVAVTKATRPRQTAPRRGGVGINQQPPRQQQPRPQPRQPRPPVQQYAPQDWQTTLDQSLQQSGERIAKIRRVRSGNTITIQYHSESVEKNVMLDGVRAPRLSSRNHHQEDFFAFAAKEFLRKHVIGAYARVKEIKASDRSTATDKFPTITLVRISIPRNEPTKLHENNYQQWADLGELICRNGFGECSLKNPIDDYYKKLLQQQQTAKNEQLGKYADLTEEEQQATIRDFEDERDGGVTVLEDIFENFKGQDIPAVVEDVVEGSTLRVELHLHEVQNSAQPIVRMVRLFCMGIQCDQVHPPEKTQREYYEKRNGHTDGFQIKQTTPLASDAKNFMKVRLSHRDIYVQVVLLDNGRLYGCIRLQNGFDPARNLLARGYAKTNWGLSALPQEQQLSYESAQEVAQNEQRGVWKTGKLAAKTVAKSRGRGISTHLITKVYSGDSFEVFDLSGAANQGRDRVFLASINCPRLAPRGRARNANKTGNKFDEVGAWAAKEFVRTTLVGKEIRLNPEYTRTNQRGDQNYVTVFYRGANGQEVDLSEELVKKGLANLVKHGGNDDRATNFPRYKMEETKATENKVGIHGSNASDELQTPTIMDYKNTRNAFANVKSFLEHQLGVSVSRDRNNNRKRRRSAKMRATIEYVAGCSRYIILLENEGLLHKLSFNLSGIRSVTDSDQIKLEGVDRRLRNTDLTAQATNYVRSKIQQRDVWITVEDLSRNGNVLGQVYTDANESICEQLLEFGFAKVNDYAVEYLQFGEQLKQKQAQAITEQTGIWKGYVPPPPEEEQEEAPPEAEDDEEEEVKPVAMKPHIIQGTLGDVEDSATVWIIQADQGGSVDVNDYMQNYNPETVTIDDDWSPETKGTTSEGQEKHRIVAGMFDDGAYYRFKINKVKRKNKKRKVEQNLFIGVFMDFGTRSTLEQNRILPIEDANVRMAMALAKRYKLCSLKSPPPSSDDFSAAGERLYDKLCGQDIKVQVMRPQRRNMVTEAELFVGDRSINQEMLEEGYCRLENKDRMRLRILEAWEDRKEVFEAAHAEAVEKHAGMFRHGAVDSGDEDDDNNNRRRRRRRN